MIIEEFQVLSVTLSRNALSKVFRFDNVVSISITIYNVCFREVTVPVNQ